MCHVCYYNNSDATFRLLMSGDINPNPGPVSASTAGKINCLVMNARSLKRQHNKLATVRNLHRFQDRGGGGVLIVIKTASFKAVKELKPESETELQQLEIIFAKITTLTGQRILRCFCYRRPNKDPSSMDVFDNFLHEVCDQFGNMVISGDYNLPDILWDSIDSASVINKLAFIETVSRPPLDTTQ